jgi:hypothetical protein
MDFKRYCEYASEIETLAVKNQRLAIHTSLKDIYREACEVAPRLIVELGVSKEALANKVLVRVAELFDSVFISCDLYDFTDACKYSQWYFVQAHDLDFAKVFGEYCASIGVNPEIDLLFIDTDELYPHTLQEIEAWFPYLARFGTVMWRCTNLQRRLIYEDGSSTNLGWNNERGVIRAIEEYLGEKFDETILFNHPVKDWRVRHWPWGGGLTIMSRVEFGGTRNGIF